MQFRSKRLAVASPVKLSGDKLCMLGGWQQSSLLYYFAVDNFIVITKGYHKLRNSQPDDNLIGLIHNLKDGGMNMQQQAVRAGAYVNERKQQWK